MSTQDAALSVEAQRLLDLLPVDATGLGNVTLRRSLGLSEDEYHRAVAELDAIGVIRHGPGRGESLGLSQATGRVIVRSLSAEAATSSQRLRGYRR